MVDVAVLDHIGREIHRERLSAMVSRRVSETARSDKVVGFKVAFIVLMWDYLDVGKKLELHMDFFDLICFVEGSARAEIRSLSRVYTRSLSTLENWWPHRRFVT
jgi:hypothetical protein